MDLVHVESGPAIDEIRTLFLEYAQSLSFSLCFQSFDTELAELPGEYAPPAGRLFLYRFNAKSAGCIALKPLDARTCEMKRLFVRPEFRGHGIGIRLVAHLIEEARQCGYASMRLDTISGPMDRAIHLYRSFGFKEIPPYYNNPIPNAVYMELTL